MIKMYIAYCCTFIIKQIDDFCVIPIRRIREGRTEIKLTFEKMLTKICILYFN
jgi:hypothetical protein